MVRHHGGLKGKFPVHNWKLLSGSITESTTPVVVEPTVPAEPTTPVVLGMVLSVIKQAYTQVLMKRWQVLI
ncbi:MAG: hypothetical protein COA44_03220 [Arcobacter sp.]|nr:MAG: hypothetical protein COA44_03220 [Arcobacter sp.]